MENAGEVEKTDKHILLKEAIDRASDETKYLFAVIEKMRGDQCDESKEEMKPERVPSFTDVMNGAPDRLHKLAAKLQECRSLITVMIFGEK